MQLSCVTVQARVRAQINDMAVMSTGIGLRAGARVRARKRVRVWVDQFQ